MRSKHRARGAPQKRGEGPPGGSGTPPPPPPLAFPRPLPLRCCPAPVISSQQPRQQLSTSCSPEPVHGWLLSSDYVLILESMQLSHGQESVWEGVWVGGWRTGNLGRLCLPPSTCGLCRVVHCRGSRILLHTGSRTFEACVHQVCRPMEQRAVQGTDLLMPEACSSGNRRHVQTSPEDCWGVAG